MPEPTQVTTRRRTWHTHVSASASDSGELETTEGLHPRQCPMGRVHFRVAQCYCQGPWPGGSRLERRPIHHGCGFEPGQGTYKNQPMNARAPEGGLRRTRPGTQHSAHRGRSVHPAGRRNPGPRWNLLISAIGVCGKGAEENL
uniref:Uncharacterized protein n=1 Tax=Myotis myotis TaxID=51298 RepID=A0A7J7Y0A6_MYOMY|nr:hypothetical protein mMyoMyo1_011307 [Myotis myotis]